MSGNHGQGRRRLIDTSSDSAESSTAYRYRAGVPALHHLPLIDVLMADDNPIHAQLAAVKKEVRDAIATAGIKNAKLKWIHRVELGSRPTNENIFAYVKAEKWEDESEVSWLDCATRIKRILEEKVNSSVGVEILAPQLYLPKYGAIVEPDHPMIQAWNGCLDHQVEHHLLQHGWVQKTICAINVIRLGYKQRAGENNITVVVTLDWSVNPTKWAGLELSLKNLIRNFQQDPINHPADTFQIDVLFENGENMLYADDEEQEVQVESETLEKSSIVCPAPSFEIQPGKSLGGKLMLTDEGGFTSLGTTGTIGPILNLEMDGKSEMFALTSYHGIRSSIPGYGLPVKAVRDSSNKQNSGIAKKDSALYKLDRMKIGFTPENLSTLLDLEKNSQSFKDTIAFKSPAMKQTEDTIQFKLVQKIDLEHIIAADKLKKGERFRKMVEAYSKNIEAIDAAIVGLTEMKGDNAEFGTLYMGASPMYRTPEGSRVDYALIKIENSVGNSRTINNQLPKLEDYPVECHYIARNIPTTHLKGIAPLEKDSRHVFKVGARTGTKVGRYSGMKAKVFLKRDGDSVRSVPQEASTTSTPGDHGTTEFVVVGGDQANQPYVDPIKNVFADQGDSGAAVWDIFGAWVGVVFGGTTLAQTTGMTIKPNWDFAGFGAFFQYITPATAIVAHIQELGKLEKKDIKVTLYGDDSGNDSGDDSGDDASWDAMDDL